MIVRRWGPHLGAYALLLLALLAATDRQHSWNLDDGAYAIQVQVLDDTGGWAYPYAHRAADPTFEFAPVSHATTTSEGTYPYVKQPAWIEVLRASTQVFGIPIGLYVPSLLGALLAALAGGVLARRLSPRAGPLGFWAVALGPLVVHTQAMWAHTAAAALGGFAAVLVVALADGEERRWHPVALAALAGGLCALRGEGPLFVVALAVTLTAVAVVRPARTGGWFGTAALWAGPAVVVGAAAKLANGRWAAHLAPGDVQPTIDVILADVGWLSGRAQGAGHTFLTGIGSTGAGNVLALAAVMFALGAGLLLRRRPERWPDALAVLVGAVVLVAVRSFQVPDDLGGLGVAVPVALAGLVAWRWAVAPLAERASVGLVGLMAGAVLLTQYPEGGSRDWGGRFLFPVLVPLVVVGTVSLWRALVGPDADADADAEADSRVEAAAGARPRLAQPVVLAVVLVLTAVPTLAGLHSAADARASNRLLADITAEVDAPTIVRIPRYLTRTSWNALPDADWLTAETDQAAAALALLRPGRTQPVAVVGQGADQVEAPGYQRDVRSPVVVIFTPD